MATKTLEIIDFSKIQSFSIQVTEKINDKYILEFLRTSIINQGLDLSKNSRFYYQFVSSSLSYEIVLFDDLKQKNIPEPFIFIQMCSETTKELFITQNYFCLFDSKELILYKDIENILQEDIQTYIEQLYKIRIDKVTVIDEEKLSFCKSEFLTNSKKYSFRFNWLKEDNSFRIFISYLFVIVLIFLFFIYISSNEKYKLPTVNENTTLYEKGYKKLLEVYKEIDKKPINKSIEVLNYLSSYNISIEKLHYKNNKLYIVLENSSRKKLLEVISNYSNKIEIHSIQFDKKFNKYKMDIVINVKK